mmetsp:Transcript_10114/g.15527  ORF Transcript_10114/g.15527 Transcript_10114/m.15527 type:complete len:339 (+) Transcript_10114:110-1126(+)
MGFIRIPQEPTFDEDSKLLHTSSSSTCDNTSEESLPTNKRLSSVRKVSEAVNNSFSLSWPALVDFNELQSRPSDEIYSICKKHMIGMSEVGMSITNEKDTPMQLMLTKELKSGITVKAEKASVVGSEIECVRHSVDLDFDAHFVLGLYSQLNYTSVIDAFTYEVKNLENIKSEERFAWAHVAYTSDRLTLPLLSHRDFVTFDFVDKENMLIVSRSCLHPSKPVTKPPKASDCIQGLFSNKVKRTLRSPLCYFLRVIPIGPNQCRVVQFQHSDVGGVVPPKEQTKAVLKFGIDNLDRFHVLLLKASEKGLEVGKSADDYLADPLKDGWKQDAGAMVTGL